MKKLGILIVLLLAAYGGYSLVRDRWQESPELQKFLPSSKPPVPPPVTNNAPVKVVRPSSEKIICPTCEGEGRLTYVDGRGRNHSYGCPVCGFSGYHIINPPKDAHICADCKGMGRIQINKNRPDVNGYIVEASRCQRCNSTGWILPRALPGSQRPTQNVNPPNPAR